MPAKKYFKVIALTLFLFIISTSSAYAANFNFTLTSFFTKFSWPKNSKVTLPKPSPTPTIKISPTRIPTATPSPTNTPTATPTPNPTAAITISEYLLKEVNVYRISQGLAEASMEKHTCDFAASRAKEISLNFSHDGFRDRINTNTLPYPGYSKVTENIAMNSNYTKVVSGWINSPGHAENMRADTPHICIAKYGSYYAMEGWRQ